MEAIFFEKQGVRSQQEIEQAMPELVLMKSDMENTFSVTFKLQMYDKKGRPIYVEQSRSKIDTELL